MATSIYAGAAPMAVRRAVRRGYCTGVRRSLAALAVGICVGIAASVIYVHARSRPSWQEQSVNSQASGLACGLAVGLGADCVPIASLRKSAPDVWIVMYGNAQHHLCYQLRPSDFLPRRAPCA